METIVGSAFEDKASYKKGKAGEVNVIDQLVKNGYQLRDFTSYPDHKFKQKKGYDIELFNDKTKEWDRIDIKTNVREGYTYLEVLKHYSGGLGWFYTSAADYVLTYDIITHKGYMYKLSEMRDYVNERKQDLKLVGRYKDLFGIKITNHLIKNIF